MKKEKFQKMKHDERKKKMAERVMKSPKRCEKKDRSPPDLIAPQMNNCAMDVDSSKSPNSQILTPLKSTCSQKPALMIRDQVDLVNIIPINAKNMSVKVSGIRNKFGIITNYSLHRSINSNKRNRAHKPIKPIRLIKVQVKIDRFLVKSSECLKDDVSDRAPLMDPRGHSAIDVQPKQRSKDLVNIPDEESVLVKKISTSSMTET